MAQLGRPREVPGVHVTDAGRISVAALDPRNVTVVARATTALP